ncbi:hypothetical protein [Paucisalibacillus globulus]|uniref:hypothetical protein n=1 Tax=Paucisalibacillus globulus TaxID=351095 RepID=UPI00041387CC|nr:hypothetical protein [Paucisalibacillus globulus]
MGQSISDSVEEDGIVYVTGGVAVGFVPIVGWSKYAKIGKVISMDKPKRSVNKTANKEGKMVGIEFTNGVIDGMRIFRDIFQGRNVNFAFDGDPGSGSNNRLINDSDDTWRRTNNERVEVKGKIEIKRLIPGTPGKVTDGSSAKLGKNMLEEMGLPRSTKKASTF